VHHFRWTEISVHLKWWTEQIGVNNNSPLSQPSVWKKDGCTEFELNINMTSLLLFIRHSNERIIFQNEFISLRDIIPLPTSLVHTKIKMLKSNSYKGKFDRRKFSTTKKTKEKTRRRCNTKKRQRNKDKSQQR